MTQSFSRRGAPRLSADPSRIATMRTAMWGERTRPDAALRARRFGCGDASGVGGWTKTRDRARWGCFLPDLTRLASGSSTANLPRAIWQGCDRDARGRRAKQALHPTPPHRPRPRGWPPRFQSPPARAGEPKARFRLETGSPRGPSAVSEREWLGPLGCDRHHLFVQTRAPAKAGCTRWRFFGGWGPWRSAVRTSRGRSWC